MAGCSILVCPKSESPNFIFGSSNFHTVLLYWEQTEMDATCHLVDSSEIFLVRWNKHVSNFGDLSS